MFLFLQPVNYFILMNEHYDESQKNSNLLSENFMGLTRYCALFTPVSHHFQLI